MSDYVTDQDKVGLLLSVTGLSSDEVACALGCEETDLLSGKLTGQQQARFVELSAAFKSGSAAIESYFGIPGENEAYTELNRPGSDGGSGYLISTKACSPCSVA